LNIASRNRVYFQHLQAFDVIYPDGVGAVWAGRWLTGKRLHKMTGADWIGEFCVLAEQQGWRVYILGGRPGVAQAAAHNLRLTFPAVQIVGAHDGYFSESEAETVLAEIVRLAPDVLFVGLGVPLQEAWIDQWKSRLPVKVCWAVGALFDYVAGVEPRAPVWMRKIDLEWLWRMMVDPVGKWKRYLLGNPLFMWRVLRQKFGFRV
jgi:N-acetylglucosaminyldiphosphoundecaprenol N-acetyl-beta-D-mannosaminyltransferase